MIGGKTCPNCAERVKRLAKVCRYCAHRFEDEEALEVEARSPAFYAVGGALLTALIVLGAWWLAPRVDRPTETSPLVLHAPKAAAGPQYQSLAIGETWKWSAETAGSREVRQAGPYVLTVTKKRSDDLVSPAVSVAYQGEAVDLQGESTSTTFEHQFAVVQNIRGAPPIVLFQSFSGGAHCCNHMQAVGVSAGRLKVIDLGSWDGDYMPVPTDITGDGIADFVLRDNRFLYAFASYAQSYSPALILNLVGGQMRDVSKRASYRKLYLQDFNRAGEVCRNGADGLDRNGACPAYIAAAARLGKLGEAWPIMLSAYDAAVDWELPTGCSIAGKSDCPDSAKMQYKSYPEALTAFLREGGYLSRGWEPDGTRETDYYGGADDPL